MMSFSKLALATFATVVLTASISSLRERSTLAGITGTRQSATTTVHLDSNDLKTPHVLSVSAPTSRLTGRVELDGKRRWGLARTTRIDLAPYLNRGVHTVTVTGNYTPADATVEINFTGANTRVEQSASGSGTLAQTLIIEVND